MRIRTVGRRYTALVLSLAVTSRPLIRRGAAILLLLLPFSATASAEQRFARIVREMQELVDTGQIPSLAVAVAKDGRIVWEAAFGWADRERGIRATPETPYSLASISKPFTALDDAALSDISIGDDDLLVKVNDAVRTSRPALHLDQRSRDLPRAVLLSTHP